MSIKENAMVLNLQIGIWQGYRLDKEASRKVTEDNNANADAARVNKHLIPKETLKEIGTASNAVRSHFYEKTLPWKDNGDRIITRIAFFEFIEEHERLVGLYKDAVEDFIADGYPLARARAEFRMGELFDPNDYPSADSLRRKFYINMDIDAISEAKDFRVDLGKQQLDDVRATMESAMNDRLKRAMGDVWARLSDVVGSFAERMGNADAIFRDATVHKIGELVDSMPGLNLVNDPDLVRIAAEVKAKLAGHDPKDLRKNPEVRSQAADDAKSIMADMAGFMNAFGGGE